MTRSAVGVVLVVLFAGACAPRHRTTTDPGALALAPAAVTPAPAPPNPSRPKSVAVWAHVDQPDGLLALVGVTPSSATYAKAAPWLELVDLTQPVDGVLVAHSANVRDVDPALRVHFKDSKELFGRMSKYFRLREEGDRVFARPKSSEAIETTGEDEWACEFVRGADVAVCGAPKAVDAVAEWLKPGPVPPAGQAHATIVRVEAYAEPLRDLAIDNFAGMKGGRQAGTGLDAFLADVDRLSVAAIERDLARPRTAMPFAITTTKEGEDGSLTAELHGARDAFRAVLDPANVGGPWALVTLLFSVFGD